MAQEEGRMKDGGDYIKFLGTAGARFVMIKQVRASGGIWVHSGGNNVLIDPGPGSLVRCTSSRPRLNPSKLNGIILTHRHLDHSGDINVMIEAMTEGGFRKRGAVFCPPDAVSTDPVILEYLRGVPERIEMLSPLKSYNAGGFTFHTSMRHRHPAETYGIKFSAGGRSAAFLADTGYFKGLEAFYGGVDILIVSVVLAEPRPGIEHFSLIDVEHVLRECRPGRAVLTHFGMTMLKKDPRRAADELSDRCGIPVLAAKDGMMMRLS
ncbi:MAG: MBL fold metallo-hydrolase [Candidatus Omnitrophota bacterium]|jgi:phosphoribosyl 1,2-cyclic phosphodiesterase